MPVKMTVKQRKIPDDWRENKSGCLLKLLMYYRRYRHCLNKVPIESCDTTVWFNVTVENIVHSMNFRVIVFEWHIM